MLWLSTQISAKNAATSSRTTPHRKKIQPPQHYSQIFVMSLLDPVSQPKCQIKKAFMKVTDHSIEKIFLLDNSTTRTVASGRELELPASLVISHQSSGYERWPVTTSTTEQMSARTESRLSRKLPRGLWDAGCETALAESSNSSEVMWGDFQLYHTGKGELIITLLDNSPLEPCQCLGRGTAVILMDPPCCLDIANLLWAEIKSK